MQIKTSLKCWRFFMMVVFISRSLQQEDCSEFSIENNKEITNFPLNRTLENFRLSFKIARFGKNGLLGLKCLSDEVKELFKFYYSKDHFQHTLEVYNSPPQSPITLFLIFKNGQSTSVSTESLPPPDSFRLSLFNLHSLAPLHHTLEIPNWEACVTLLDLKDASIEDFRVCGVRKEGTVMILPTTVTIPSTTTSKPPVLDPCVVDPNAEGCRREPPEDTCPNGYKLCSTLPDSCIPNKDDCAEYGPDHGVLLPSLTNPCQHIVSPLFDSQTIFCGSGLTNKECFMEQNSSGASGTLYRYHNTEVFIQCGKAAFTDLIDVRIVNSIGHFSWWVDKGGAGIYRCRNGQWFPQETSPSLESLEKTCISYGCGELNAPSPNNLSDRPWPFVRKLTIMTSTGEQHCLATLISPYVAITAAHCVEYRINGLPQELHPDSLSLEVPGPQCSKSLHSCQQDFQPTSVRMHPSYKRGDGVSYDVALLIFKQSIDNKPFACLLDYGNLVGQNGMVFKTIEGFPDPQVVTSQSHPCLGDFSTSITCPKPSLDVPKNKIFCAEPESFLPRGSSGGPYLVKEMSTKKWVVTGVFREVRTMVPKMWECPETIYSLFTKIDTKLYNWITTTIISDLKK